MRKKGVSLIVLVITIVVLSILSGTVIVKVQDYSSSAKLAAFLNNLSQIQDYVYSKNLLNEKINLKLEASYTIDELVEDGYLNSKVKDTFEEEVISNGGSSDSRFCIIDMENLEDIETNVGYGKNSTDYFAYDTTSLKVYYLSGVYYNSKRYFSVTSEFTNISTKNEENKESYISIDSTSGLSVTKTSTVSSNKLGITITANLSGSEEVEIKIGEEASSKFKNNNSKFKVSFDDIESLNDLVKTPFSTDIIDNLDESKKYITINIVENNKIKATYKINITNYDSKAPTITNITSKKYSTYNLVTGKCQDNLGKTNSGINYIKYEYEKEKPTTDYMIENSKISYCDDEGNFSIKIPLNIQKVEIICIDNAENVSGIYECLV